MALGEESQHVTAFVFQRDSLVSYSFGVSHRRFPKFNGADHGVTLLLSGFSIHNHGQHNHLQKIISVASQPS